VQVQLPSDPIHWTPVLGPTCQPSPVDDLVPTWLLPLRGTVDLLGTSTLPNDGRVSGTSEISVFDYRVSGLGIATLCLRPTATRRCRSPSPGRWILAAALLIVLSRLSRASTTSISPRASAASRPWAACSLAGSAFRPRFVSTASVRRSRRRPVRTRDGVARSTSSTPVCGWEELPLVSIGEVVTRFTLCVVGGIEVVPDCPWMHKLCLCRYRRASAI
jgi:hypothetical protein